MNLITGGLLTAGLNLGSNLITNLFNYSSNKQANQANIQMNDANIEWQKQQYYDQQAYQANLQNVLFQREDNAYERTRNDLINSGYSPLAINGTNSAGSVVSSPSIPSLQTAQMSPFTANAPQFGEIIDALRSADEMALKKRQLDIQEQANLDASQQKEADRSENARQFDAQLAETATNHAQQLDAQMSQIAETERHNRQQEIQTMQQVKQLEKTFDMNMSRQTADLAREKMESLTGLQGSSHIQYMHDEQECKEAFQTWAQGLQDVIDDCIQHGYFDIMSESSSDTTSWNGGISANLPKKFANVGAGVNAGYTGSESQGLSKNLTERARAEIRKYCIKNPMPYYVGN